MYFIACRSFILIHSELINRVLPIRLWFVAQETMKNCQLNENTYQFENDLIYAMNLICFIFPESNQLSCAMKDNRSLGVFFLLLKCQSLWDKRVHNLCILCCCFIILTYWFIVSWRLRSRQSDTKHKPPKRFSYHHFFCFFQTHEHFVYSQFANCFRLNEIVSESNQDIVLSNA